LAKERKASVIYEGNGTQQTFSFPFDYLRKTFIKAEIVEGSGITELEQGKDYSITDKELTLNSGVSVATGKLLKIYRETTTAPLVEWQDASVLRSADLSLQEVQVLHLAEETADKVFDTGMSTSPTNTNVWDGQYKRLTDLLDPQEDGDAVTLRYINSNQSSLLNELKNEGANQNTSIVATGDTQNTRLTNTGDSYVATMTTLKEDATMKATEASNSATSASSSASTATMKATEASNSATSASSSASTATMKATEASNSATSASSSASTATMKATEASNSATSASSSASTATTKATEASNSAELAKKWAMSDSSPDGVSGNKSSKTWANEAKKSATSASSSASTATTKATEASNSASAAAKSAENAKTWDPTSYYTKTEVDNKLESMVDLFYPVGSVYISADKSKTKADFPFMQYGTWEEVPANLCLQTGESSEAGTQKSAGLPNITGDVGGVTPYSPNGDGGKLPTGAFSFTSDVISGVGPAYNAYWNMYRNSFDASHSNPIYGASNTVQPPAYMVRAWVRTA
jgi:hypothetical protein